MEQTVIRSKTVQSIIDYLKVGQPAIHQIVALTYRSASKNQEIVKLLTELSCHYQVRSVFFHTKLLSVEDLEMIHREVGPSFTPDLILAIGGGSVIDAGKGLRYLYATHICSSDIIGHNQNAPAGENQVFDIPNFWVAPTTAGTGSEATCFGVLYQEQKKYSIESYFLLPDVVFLLPGLLESVPVTAQATAMLDALSQAIESLWSIRSTEESRGYAKKALEEINDLLPWFENRIITKSSLNLKRMQEAAYLSGKAINISKTTLAHALSYPLTAHYGIPHGLAVFLNLPAVWEYNCQCPQVDCVAPQGYSYLNTVIRSITSVFQAAGPEAVPEIFRGILRRLNFSPNLRDYLTFEAVERIVMEAAGSNRTANNPRQMKGKELLNIFKKHYYIFSGLPGQEITDGKSEP
ncbi:MAG TPA: iron-containing alcohol dehydrogenase [Bacillota bacterium]|nr:iron-containing alcohol dehydrogenase [Bacillota bacterium]